MALNYCYSCYLGDDYQTLEACFGEKYGGKCQNNLCVAGIYSVPASVHDEGIKNKGSLCLSKDFLVKQTAGSFTQALFR